MVILENSIDMVLHKELFVTFPLQLQYLVLSR